MRPCPPYETSRDARDDQSSGCGRIRQRSSAQSGDVATSRHCPFFSGPDRAASPGRQGSMRSTTRGGGVREVSRLLRGVTAGFYCQRCDCASSTAEAQMDLGNRDRRPSLPPSPLTRAPAPTESDRRSCLRFFHQHAMHALPEEWATPDMYAGDPSGMVSRLSAPLVSVGS